MSVDLKNSDDALEIGAPISGCKQLEIITTGAG